MHYDKCFARRHSSPSLHKCTPPPLPCNKNLSSQSMCVQDDMEYKWRREKANWFYSLDVICIASVASASSGSSSSRSTVDETIAYAGDREDCCKLCRHFDDKKPPLNIWIGPADRPGQCCVDVGDVDGYGEQRHYGDDGGDGDGRRE